MLSEADVEDKKVREIPIEWRLRTREAFQSLFGRGYQVIDFRKSNFGGRKRDFYVLEK